MDLKSPFNFSLLTLKKHYNYYSINSILNSTQIYFNIKSLTIKLSNFSLSSDLKNNDDND